jgi:hypothetical protein
VGAEHKAMALIVPKSRQYREKAAQCWAAASNANAEEQRHFYQETASMWEMLAVDAEIRTNFLQRNQPRPVLLGLRRPAAVLRKDAPQPDSRFRS